MSGTARSNRKGLGGEKPKETTTADHLQNLFCPPTVLMPLDLRRMNSEVTGNAGLHIFCRGVKFAERG